MIEPHIRYKRGRKMNRHACGKKFTLASKLALVGGLLVLLNPFLTMVFWLPRSPGMAVMITPAKWLFLTFWVVGQIVCGVAIMICAQILKFKPRHSVTLGAAIIVLSLLFPSYIVLANYPNSIDRVLYTLLSPMFFIMDLGIVLGVFGGLWMLFGGKAEMEI